MNFDSLALLGILFLIADVHSLRYDLQPNTERCFRKDIPANFLVVGEYDVAEAHGQKVEFKVRDSKGHILAQKENIPYGKSLKFSFVTDVYDTFNVCFSSHVPPEQRGVKQEVHVDIKEGIEAKNYEGIGEAAKLKPIEVELKKLEDLSEAIVQDFARMRKNEEEMRDTNETTNSRVLYFSIFSMCCLLGLATWQVFYLRRYFRAKKLIE